MSDIPIPPGDEEPPEHRRFRVYIRGQAGEVVASFDDMEQARAFARRRLDRLYEIWDRRKKVWPE